VPCRKGCDGVFSMQLRYTGRVAALCPFRCCTSLVFSLYCRGMAVVRCLFFSAVLLFVQFRIAAAGGCVALRPEGIRTQGPCPARGPALCSGVGPKRPGRRAGKSGFVFCGPVVISGLPAGWRRWVPRGPGAPGGSTRTPPRADPQREPWARTVSSSF
jgi:hypothetical protein